jgi:hypothetical protein
MGNATEVVGALRQDRHSAIEGELGATAQMIPVTMRVRSFNPDNSVHKTRDFHFSVFVDHKWTPYLMMATLFNSISNLNDFSEEATYRLHGELQVEGNHRVELSTMQAPAGTPIPTPMLLAGWWGDKFNRLFLNSSKLPKLNAVNVSIDLLPERRIAQIESAWIGDNKVNAGTEVRPAWRAVITKFCSATRRRSAVSRTSPDHSIASKIFRKQWLCSMKSAATIVCTYR